MHPTREETLTTVSAIIVIQVGSEEGWTEERKRRSTDEIDVDCMKPGCRIQRVSCRLFVRLGVSRSEGVSGQRADRTDAFVVELRARVVE
eukprot:3116682-Rhodomonas_salina.1